MSFNLKCILLFCSENIVKLAIYLQWLNNLAIEFCYAFDEPALYLPIWELLHLYGRPTYLHIGQPW